MKASSGGAIASALGMAAIAPADGFLSATRLEAAGGGVLPQQNLRGFEEVRGGTSRRGAQDAPGGTAGDAWLRAQRGAAGLGALAMLAGARRAARSSARVSQGASRRGPPAGSFVTGAAGPAGAGAKPARLCAVSRAAAESDDAGAGAWTRRDQLLEIEEKVQKMWDEKKIYEVDAPDDGPEGTQGKFFVTFPFPYMNGRLHLGHAFSLLKAEFAARFKRLDGNQVLFPFAFHCTGMPISAAAMKLQGCLEARKSAKEEEPVLVEASGDAAEEASDEPAAPGVYKGTKSKAAAKSGGLDQYDIMVALGIGEEEIPKFVDPNYWLKYFPPRGVQDMKKLGTAVDWRRSFITTDENPFYDAFVRWQFLKLRQKYLGSGYRASIYSTRTQQPCADHDRAEGEGVNPQEYTLIKLKVQEVPAEWADALGGRDVFLTAATLRPETMYGQTNCFVLPEGDYGFYQTKGGEVLVSSSRAALNMAYQDILECEEGPDGQKAPVCLLEKSGKDLVGLPLSAPLATYDTVHVLPMMTISMGKGTGIVTSVPAEAPDDFACLNDWQTRANWREQFGVKEEWCQPFKVVEIMEIEGSEYGNASAPFICEKMKIGSHKEKDKLAAAKKEVYLKGFYDGKLTVGPYAGQKVQDVKAQIKSDLIENGQALQYYEPENRVVARSGDDCVVALCDQWYLKYSDEEWTQRVKKHVDTKFEMFNEASMNNLKNAVGWLGDWACSRTFGLGTKMPWDEKWLIESLSDSTVYMAYYTVAHIIQGGNMRGEDGFSAIQPADLTEEVFDYVFQIKSEPPAGSAIAAETLEKMRKEFSFWYPLDLRCSGKDLINNHLTMSLFNHAAVWEDEKYMPQAFYCNGHVMVDSEKMSKSKGNFLSLDEAIGSYSADATRIVCADSGDGLEDANFSRDLAGNMIMRLTTLQSWVEGTVAQLPSLRKGDMAFLDEIFDNEITTCIQNAHKAYNGMRYSDALRASLFDMENLRSQYALLSNGDLHADVIQRFLEVQMVIFSPIAPHFCEHVWQNVLGKSTFVVQERWPTPEREVDSALARKYEVIQGTLKSFRQEYDKHMSGGKKGKKGKAAKPEKPTHMVIFVAKAYKQWQQDVLGVLQTLELDEDNSPKNKEFMRMLKDSSVMKEMPKANIKKAMPFASFIINQEVKRRGPEALNTELPFDEAGMLRDLMPVIKSQIGVENVEIADSEAEFPSVEASKREAADPGSPKAAFYAEEVAAAS